MAAQNNFGGKEVAALLISEGATVNATDYVRIRIMLIKQSVRCISVKAMYKIMYTVS